MPKNIGVFRIVLLLLLVLLVAPLFPTNAISTFTKYSGNPIFSPSLDPNAWDNKHILASNIMYHNGIYRMWYTGFNDNQAQIGYAESINGISDWNKLNTPVIPADINKSSGAPSVIFNGSNYDKVLSKGKLTKPIKVTCKSFSNSAVEKIKQAGGEAITC